jgi:hypothetical protein
MWREYNSCPLGESKHSFYYDKSLGLFKCPTCCQEKILTSFDVEVEIVARYIKFVKENPFLFPIKEYEDGRFSLANAPSKNTFVKIWDCAYSVIYGKDAQGDDKRRWVNVGKAFEYDDGTFTVNLDTIPFMAMGKETFRFKLFPPRERNNEPSPLPSPPQPTDGFGD